MKISENGWIKMFSVFVKSLAAGVAIGMGATAYMSCENKIIGSLMFCVGLFAICFFELKLYTGKIGYLFDMKKPWQCAIIWLGNALGCIACGIAVRFALPNVAETARVITEQKLEIDLLRGAVLGIFCGVLMYIAVHNYATNPHGIGKCIGILLCVPAFIICGFEHCIANVLYFTIGIRDASQLPRVLLMTLVVSVANGVGAILFRKLSLAFKKEKVK